MLKLRQTRLIKSDTLKENKSIPTGSAVAVPRECGKLWTHSTTIEHGDVEHMGDHTK